MRALILWLSFRGGSYYFLHTDEHGVRHVSWRLWVLVWVAPALFTLAALFLAFDTLRVQSGTEVTTGTVVEVYEWDNDAPQIFYPGDRVYGPVFEYQWTDGSRTRASTGASHTGWNFPVGTEMPIRYWPDRKADVTIVGPMEWYLARTIGLIAAVTFLPALLVTLLLWRWKRRGARPGTVKA